MDLDFSTAGKNNVPLHPESQKYVKKLVADAMANAAEIAASPPSIDGIRQAVDALVKQNIDDKYDYSGTIRDTKLPAAYLPEGIPARVYQPSSMTSHPLIMVFYHGGGHVSGGIDQVDHLCRIMSCRYNCIVVSVGYRLAPEVKLPEIIKDCDEAAKWVVENKEAVGGSSNSLVGVAGSSAGGHLAACVCHNVPGLAFQILVYPMIDPRCGHPSIEEYANIMSLMKDGLLMLYAYSIENEAQKSDPVVNPLLRSRHDNLPPAFTIVAECDILRDEGICYSEKMKESGSHSELLVIKGSVHSFFDFTGTFKELSGMAFDAIGEYLERVKTGALNKISQGRKPYKDSEIMVTF